MLSEAFVDESKELLVARLEYREAVEELDELLVLDDALLEVIPLR